MQTTNLATDKQKGFIANLMTRKAYPAEVNLTTLTKAQASGLIDVLLALPDTQAPRTNAQVAKAAVQKVNATPTVPDGRYAVSDSEGVTNFFEVNTGKDGGKWEGFCFVTRLTGTPGGFNKYAVKGSWKADVLKQIVADGPENACRRFGRELGICGICGSPLTDPDSRAAGIGPVCRKKF